MSTAGDAWAVAMKLFEAVDDNGDGELSWAELHEYLSGPQVKLKPKECEDLFKLLDANDDGTVSKFEFATGFEKFRGKVVELKDAEMDRAIESKRRAEHMQGTKASGTKGSSSATATTSTPKTRAAAATRTMSSSATRTSAGTSESGGGGVGGFRKVASPSSAPTKVRAAQSNERGSGGAAGVGGDGTKRKNKKQGGLIAQVSRGVGKFFGFSSGDAVGREENTSNSEPALIKSTSSTVKKKKWFGFSFIEMFGLKALTTTVAPVNQNSGGETGEDGEGVVSGDEGVRGGANRRDPRNMASDAPPDTIWVRGTKAEGYRVNIVKSSSLKKLQSLFDDMDSDRDGHITSTEFNAFVDGSIKGKSKFQREIFDRISNEHGLCSYKSMLHVLYPGASPEQIETMLKMSKSWQEKDLAGGSKSRRDKKGPTKEQVEEAENVFRSYDGDKDGFISEEEFAKGLSATGVYTYEDAIREFNRMDIDDNKNIDMKEFTIWYVAMDEIGRRSRRNA